MFYRVCVDLWVFVLVWRPQCEEQERVEQGGECVRESGWTETGEPECVV